MSVLNRKVRTSFVLWGAASAAVLALLGSVNLLPEAKGTVPYWAEWGTFLRGDYYCGADEMWLSLMSKGLFLGVTAVVAGWVVQAFIVLGIALVRARPPSPEAQSGA
jgi:hypothetical protein